MRCTLCGSSKIAIQYLARRTYRNKKGKLLEAEGPGVCVVCPRCDCLGSSAGYLKSSKSGQR